MCGTKTLTLHALPAGCGDCAVIEYGENGASNLVIVDCGTAPTAKHLIEFLQHRPNSKVELLVVSHIDSDHIAGSKAILETDEVASRIQDIWFNGVLPPSSPDTLETFGIAQGDELSERLKTLPHNRIFEHLDVVVGDDGALPAKVLPAGAKLTLLSPSVDALSRLKKYWKDKQKKVVSAPPTPAEELGEGFERMGAGDALSEKGVDNLAGAPFENDTSLHNEASIAFLFEYGEARILMAADAHVGQLLSAARRFAGGAAVPVDLFKVSHHGSDRNVNADLLQAFPSRRYLVSTDGVRHGHPTDVALARIARASPKCELIFNYRHDVAQRWSDFARLPKNSVRVTTPAVAGKLTTLNLLPRRS